MPVYYNNYAVSVVPIFNTKSCLFKQTPTFSYCEVDTYACIREGANMGSAINGASIRDRNLPSLWKAVLKLPPHNYPTKKVEIYMNLSTIWFYNEPHQLQQRPASLPRVYKIVHPSMLSAV